MKNLIEKERELTGETSQLIQAERGIKHTKE